MTPTDSPDPSASTSPSTSTSTNHRPATATGHFRRRNDGPYLEFARTFRAPIADVWDAVTDPVRLNRWIGTWSGDPSTGTVTFRMTAEGDDVADETIWIDVCERPTRLVMRSLTPDDPDTLWRWDLALAEADGVTTLTFAQEVTDADLAESVGPGWDYYLDRLVVAEAGGDPSTVDFEDYHPALSAHYRAELAAGGSGA